jgi:hypothetical protein
VSAHQQQHEPLQQPQDWPPGLKQQYGVAASVQQPWFAVQQILPPQQVEPASQQLAPQTCPTVWHWPFTHC